MIQQYEITYTFFGKERPVFAVEADSPEAARAKFHTIKPGVPEGEIQSIQEIIPEPVSERRWQAAQTRIGHIKPRPMVNIEADILSRADTRVRFLWAPRLDAVVRQRFAELGRALPLEAQPIETGRYGGVTELYSLSCDIYLPVSASGETLPDAKMDNGVWHVYDVALGLELFCNQGFVGVFKGVESEV